MQFSNDMSVKLGTVTRKGAILVTKLVISENNVENYKIKIKIHNFLISSA